MKKIIFALFLFAFLISPCFAKIYASQPELGEKMDILVDGGGNKSVIVIDPYERRVEKALDERGQAQVEIVNAGKWSIIFGEERLDLEVGPSLEQEAAGGGQLGVGLAVFALAVFALIAIAGAGGAIFSIKKIARRQPCLRKWKEGKRVSVEFRAGDEDLQQVRVVDEAVKGWEEGKILLEKKHLPAGERVFLEYEHEGELLEAKAFWKTGGGGYCLGVREGKVEFEKKEGPEKKKNEGKKRKLKKA